MRVVALKKLMYLRKVHSDTALRWHLLNTLRNEKPVVRLHNFKNNPMTICRHIHFDEYNPYYGEIYDEPFHLPLDVK